MKRKVPATTEEIAVATAATTEITAETATTETAP